MQDLAGKVYSVQLYLGFVGRKTTILWSLLKCPCRLDFSTHNPKGNLASSGFWWVTLCRLATFIAHVFISESRSWLTAASIWSCFVAARGRAMLFKICSLSDSLLALAVTISTSKPFLDWNELKCNKKWKKLCRSGGNKNPQKMNTQRPQTTNLHFFHEVSPANFHQTDPELLICLFTSEILKLSWAALRFVWEILLPAATWQRNLRMESAAAPFQISHLWWHGLLHHHHQWQLGLTTRCCQHFLRISDGGRQLPITPISKKFPKLNAFWEELRSILLFVFEKSSAQLELWTKKEQCNEHNVKSQDIPPIHQWRKKMAAYFRVANFE